jgi:hypothetical protein
MQKLNALDWIALVLVIVGGLNWGLVGLLNFNLVTAIFGENSIADIIFVLVGISAVYLLFVVGAFTKKGEKLEGQM